MSHANIITDASTETPGIIAGELAAEEDELMGQNVNYGSLHDNNNSNPSDNQIDDFGGFALPETQLKVVLASLFMAAYLAALDTTVVTTLLALIASDLNAVGNISWIATAYLLSSAALQPIFGKLSDIFGRRILLLICTLLFAIGCLICATDSLLWLVIGRFITGCGGSGMTCLGTITMSDLIPLRQRGYYQGLANVCFGLGSASGGIVGGLIADYFGWKWVFIFQVPLAFFCFLGLYFFLNLPAGSPGNGSPGHVTEKLKRVDFLGSFCLVTFLMSLLTAASLGGKDVAYTSKTFIGLCIISATFLFAFIYVESSVSEEPIIPMHLLKIRTIIASSLTNWFYTMAIFTVLFYIPIYYTSVMDLTATQNGLRLVPNFFAASAGSVGAGIYMRRTGKYYKATAIIGLFAMLGSVAILNLTPQIPTWAQFVILLPGGFGYSWMLTVTLLALIAAVPSKFQACTTSVQYTFRSTGSTLGVSIASAIFQHVLRSSLNQKVKAIITDPHKAAKIIKHALANTDYTKTAPKLVQPAIRESYALGCKGAFAFSLATITLGYVCSLFMKEHKLHTSVNRD
jgi:MFS family permease